MTEAFPSLLRMVKARLWHIGTTKELTVCKTVSSLVFESNFQYPLHESFLYKRVYKAYITGEKSVCLNFPHQLVYLIFCQSCAGRICGNIGIIVSYGSFIDYLADVAPIIGKLQINNL